MTRRRSNSVKLGARYLGLAASAALVGPGVAACGSDEPQEQVYCTNADGVIVDEDYCDDSSGHGVGGFFFLSYGNYGYGHQPGHQLTGGQRIAYNDKAGRAQLGLPTTGKVGNGVARSGGFGTGSGGAKSSGGASTGS